MKLYIYICFLFCFLPTVSCKNSKTSWQIKELNSNSVANISALSKTYGYIRYFYPNDNLKKFDWYKFLILSIEEIEEAESDEAFVEKMLELFLPICPDIQLKSAGDSASPSSCSNSQTFYVQTHTEEKTLESGHIIQVTHKEDWHPVPDSLYCFPLKENLFVSFPIAVTHLPSKGRDLRELEKKMKRIQLKLLDTSLLKALIKPDTPKNIDFIKSYSTRIADVIIRRNIVQHFYPYYQEEGLESSWDTTCEEFYYKVATSTNQYNYYENICQLMHRVKDFHITVLPDAYLPGIAGGYLREYYPNLPFNLTLSEDNSVELLIHENDSSCFVVKEINGIKTEDILKEKLETISYSTDKSGIYKLAATGLSMRSFKKDSVMLLSVKGDSSQKQRMKIKTEVESYHPANPKDSVFIANINDSVVYVNICSPAGSYNIFAEQLDLLQESSAIIMDMRGYPQPYTMSILAHLTDSVLSLGNLQGPVIFFPDQKGNRYYEVDKWHIAPALSTGSTLYSEKYEYPAPAGFRLRTPVYFFADGTSVSYAETLLDIIKHYKLGTIVGDYTAGCNGDALYIEMPFASFMMSVAKFQFRDGSQHHTIGIKPDVFINESVSSCIISSQFFNILKEVYNVENLGTYYYK